MYEKAMYEKHISSVKSLLLKAWRERWPDMQWGICIKKILPKGLELDSINLAELILQQALVGSSPNMLVLSYLKHAQSSQVITNSSVLKSVLKYDDVSKPYCINSLLDLVAGFISRISCQGTSEDPLVLSKSIQQTINWLLLLTQRSLMKLQDKNPSPEYSSIVDKACDTLGRIVTNPATIALLYVAKFEDTDTSLQIEQTELNVRGVLNQLHATHIGSNLREKVEAMLQQMPSLRSLPNPESDDADTVSNTSTLGTISVLLTTEAVLNPMNDILPIVEQLLLIEKIKGLSRQDLYGFILRSCFMGLIDSKDGPEELKWAAFTFLKIPLILSKIKDMSKGRNNAEELEQGFEYLLTHVPLLDLTDAKCNCDCLHFLLVELCNKHPLLNEAHCRKLTAKRKETQKPRPQEQQNTQPSASLILRAEPTVTSILKTLDADYSKNQEALLGVLCHMMSGKSFELILAAAAATGKLQSFALKLIKFNEFAKSSSGEGGKAAETRALLFDITFLMVCHIAQLYGSELISTSPECADSFFAQWVQRCLPEEGKCKSLEGSSFEANPSKVDVLLSQLKVGGELQTSLTKWQDVCNNVPYTMQEVLYAWEHGALTNESVQGILTNVKSRMCCLSVVVGCWLCSHISRLGDGHRQKPISMLQQLMQPVQAKQENQFYAERSHLMTNIFKLLKLTNDLLPGTGSGPVQTSPKQFIQPTSDIKKQVLTVFRESYNNGWVSIANMHFLEQLFLLGGAEWFCEILIREMLSYNRLEEVEQALAIIYSLFHLDLEQMTLSLLHCTLPRLLQGKSLQQLLIDPRGRGLAKLCVRCIGAAYITKKCTKSEQSVQFFATKGRKRTRRDIEIEDMDSTGDMKPSKMRKLHEETHQLTLDSEGFNIDQMWSPREESPSPTYDVKDPLNKALVNLFHLLNCIVNSWQVNQKTGFVMTLLEEAVKMPKGVAKFILQFMPPGMVPQLLKIFPDNFSSNLVLSACDLNTQKGRRIAAMTICLNARYQFKSRK